MTLPGPTPPAEIPAPVHVTSQGRWSDANRAAAELARKVGEIYARSYEREPTEAERQEVQALAARVVASLYAALGTGAMPAAARAEILAGLAAEDAR